MIGSMAVPEDVRKNEQLVQRSILDFVTRDFSSSAIESAYTPLLVLAMQYKHIGFHEENEVRIIAFPMADEITAVARALGRDLSYKHQYHNKSGLLIPYLELPIAQRAIKRVIVGPHPDQSRRQRAVQMQCKDNGLRFEVTTSAIPFIG